MCGKSNISTAFTRRQNDSHSSIYEAAAFWQLARQKGSTFPPVSQFPFPIFDSSLESPCRAPMMLIGIMMLTHVSLV